MSPTLTLILFIAITEILILGGMYAYFRHGEYKTQMKKWKDKNGII